MKCYLILLFNLIFLINTFGQVDNKSENNKNLETYLCEHRTYLTLNTDSTLSLSYDASSLISSKMKNKNLFVIGENNHNYFLTNKLRILFIKKFSKHGLKDVFIEYGRSTAAVNNAYIKSNYNLSYPPYLYKVGQNLNYAREMEQTKEIYNKSADFNFVGIDFERTFFYFRAIDCILNYFNTKEKEAILQVAPYLHDTSILHYTNRQSKHYFKKIQNDFIKDSATFKSLFKTQYNNYKYLVTNKDICLPSQGRKRDKLMAENLLKETQELPNNKNIYLLSCGYFHSNVNKKNSLLGRLSESSTFKNKILILNLYCNNCNIDIQGISIDGFMKKDILKTFQHAANNKFVLFDLSELPIEYEYIKKQGDLLLFVN